MNLNDMTRDQLKAEAKKRGLTKYHAWSGAKLIQEITKFDTEAGTIENPADQANEKETEAETISNVNEVQTKLSPQAIKWKEYFLKTNTTPAAFLQRYPNHKFKIFISELL
jgi:hypothetical protein